MLTAAPVITFSEKFCAQHQLAPERYEAAVLRLTLHTPARLLQPLLGLFPGYFSADRGFVRGVGRITRLRDFDPEALDFADDPANRGVLRQRLRLRVSTRRMRRLVHATLHDATEAPSQS